MNFADLHTRPTLADALPDSSLLRGEDDYRFRVRQLEGELSVQSKLTAELEQSNAQLEQQIFQAHQTRNQLQQRCSHFCDMVRAQMKETKGNNEEIALLRGQLHELRGQHQRLLAERLAPVASLPHEPGPASKPTRPLQMVCLSGSEAWVDVFGGGLIPDRLNHGPRNAPPFQDFDCPERQRLALSRSQSSDLSPEEKEVIKTRMLTDRGPGRRSSSSDGGGASPRGEDNRESETKPCPERATVGGGASRGVKVEAGARSPGEVDGSLPSCHGNGTSPRITSSSPLPSEDCVVRRAGSKGWYAGVNPAMKKEDQGAEDSSDDEKPSPSPEAPSTATPDSEVGDEDEDDNQREGLACKESGKVHGGDAAAAATPLPSTLPADNEGSLRSSASHPIEIASPHAAIPYNGALSKSVEPHGPAHDGRKPSAHEATVNQGPVFASGAPTTEGAAICEDTTAESRGVLVPSSAIVAEPKSMEVVASPASADARIASEESDDLPVSPPSASNFRRKTVLPSREAGPGSTMQVDPVEDCPAKETAVNRDGPSESVVTTRASAKAPKVETCVPFENGRVPPAPDHVLDRYQYVTFCSECREARVERQAVALCQLCPRIFCGVCAASLGQKVDLAPGASDVLLPGEKCICLQRDSEFSKPPKGVRPEAHLLEQLFAHDLSLQFREEVDVVDNPGYLGVITRSEMMDFGTMKENMRRKRYETTRGQRIFRLDVKQIWLNCWKFAGCSPESDAPLPGIVSCASILERMVGKFCDAHMQGQEELFENAAGNRTRHEQFAHLARNAAFEESEEEEEFVESDEETESEPEPEMVDVLPPSTALAGRKRKAAPDSPRIDGMEISSDTDRPQECGASPTTEEPAEILCSLAGIGEKLLGLK